MTDQPVIDTHLHLWDPARLNYPWHKVVTAMNRPFLLPDYKQASETIPIESMVFVQCDCAADQSRDEVAMVSEFAKIDPRLRGIVAFAALERGSEIESELAWLADQPLVKGVRRITQGEPDADFCLSENYIAGTRLLAKYNLSCDLCITHSQLAAATNLAASCPDVRFILDHLGKPDIKAGLLDPWREDMKRLAAEPNTWCKLSGVVTEADHDHWTTADIEPYVLHAIDCFGPDRIIYGGDWPVVTLACDYHKWFSTISSILESISVDEQRAIMHDNAMDFYRIDHE